MFDTAVAAEPIHIEGSPVFRDPRLAALAESQGAAAAWRTVLARGPAAIGEVDGDFAVAMQESSGRTVLAVDRFAVRTLCWRLTAGGLRFASRADELADASTPLDPQALFDYLYGHTIAAPRTIFQGVLRLPAGHCAVYENGRLSVAPYWTPVFEEPERPDFPALRDEFRERVRDAVARGLDGGKPACFLSGGTDSSTVAGMIGLVTGRAAATYSIGFDAEGYDEMAYARIAARRFGTEHHEHYVTPADLVASIPQVAASYDQPFGNSSVLPSYYCARFALADGATKVLAGDGGDELFGGNSRYAKQRVFGWYEHLPSALRRRVIEPVFALPGMRRMPLLRKGASYIEQARIPMPDRLQTYNQLRRLGIAEVLEPSFLAMIDVDGPVRQQREVWRQAHTDHEINRTLAFDWRYTLAENDLPKVRGATELAGIEVGFPLLDSALLDFSLRLPARYKLNRLQLRWFFKEALRGFLPDEILAKKKHGFGLPFGVWTMRDAALKRLAFDSLSTLAERGIVRPAFIRTLTDTLFPMHPGFYGEMIWILMMLEQWLRKHRVAYSAD
jgi:asparagine synthase (glutamine-hydrolysing)